MEPTYEKDGINLKITTPVIVEATLAMLRAEKEAVEADIAGLDEQYASNVAVANARLASVNARLDEATVLGVDEE